MFALNKTQIRIIARILSVEKRIESKQIGVTKYDLEHNSKHDKDSKTEWVSRRTFRDNEKDLTDSFCIKIASEEKHGKQTVRTYQVTPIGFFHFLKSEKITKIDTIHQEHFKRFFPNIGGQWNDNGLLSIYDRKLLLMILKYSFESVEVEQGSNTWRSQGEKIQNQFRFTIKIPIVEDISDIHLKKYFFTIPHKTKYKKEITKKYNKDKIPFHYSQDISFFIDELVALFYLNLLRLHYDVVFQNRIFSVFSDEPQKNDYTISEMAKYNKKYSEFADSIDESTKKLFDTINNDSQLQKLLTDFIADIKESLNIPEYLTKIKKKIT
ncbi:hypothetical protein [Nitrosopumilus sp.]|uniref:hypothetical protein n=1 Tax=Nitrosopumilus sp. TaxID=2024843 RepID=UPI003D124837